MSDLCKSMSSLYPYSNLGEFFSQYVRRRLQIWTSALLWKIKVWMECWCWAKDGRINCLEYFLSEFSRMKIYLLLFKIITFGILLSSFLQISRRFGLLQVFIDLAILKEISDWHRVSFFFHCAVCVRWSLLFFFFNTVQFYC